MLTNREQTILEAFNFANEDAFNLWVDEGCPMFEGDLDSPNLIYDKEGYRVRTDEDRRIAREAAEERQRRYEAGEMSSFETLMYKTMQGYTQHMSDALFRHTPFTYIMRTPDAP